MSGPLLDRGRMLAAFALLDQRLALSGVVAEVHVVGGAAMSLAWEERRTTRDVDAVFDTDGHGQLLREIHWVADHLALPRSWLNEQATMYAPADYRSSEGTVFDGTNLRVAAAAPAAVLAMKVRASRPTDVADIVFLLGMLDVSAIDEVIAIHDHWFPGDPLPQAKRMLVEDVLGGPPTSGARSD